MDKESKYTFDNNTNGYLNNTTRTLASQDCLDNFLKASTEKTNKLKIYARILDRNGVSSNFLEELYLKYSVNLQKYFANNREGMKLTGNKHFEQYPYQMFTHDQGNGYQNNNIEINEQNKTLDMWNFEDKYFLTPLPNKSRKLLNTKKEKNDFQHAERLAVVMRTYEYTHGLRSKLGVQEYQQMINEEKEKALMRMKSIVNKIQLWYKKQKAIREKKLKDKRKREEMENKEFQEKYSKYLIALSKKKKLSGITKIETYINKLLLPAKKQFLEKFKKSSQRKSNEPFKLVKSRNKNMYNWYTQIAIVSSKNINRSFSILSQPKLIIKKKVKSKIEFKTKKVSSKINIWEKFFFLQRKIKSYLNYVSLNPSKDSYICIKPYIAVCYLSLCNYNQYALNEKLNKLNALINKKISKLDNISLYSAFKQWNRKSQEVMRKDNNDKKKKTALLLFSRYVTAYLSKVKNKNLQYSYNKIKSKERCYKVMYNFKQVLLNRVNNKIVSSLQYQIFLKRLTQAIILCLTKASLQYAFYNWNSKIKAIYYMHKSIFNYSIGLSRGIFFENLSQMNKRIISNYSHTKSSTNNYDNNFRYYCIINKSNNQNDFYSFRFVLGFKILSNVLKHNIDSHSIIKGIKKHKAQKNPKGELIQQEIIKLNPRLSSKLNQFRSKLEKIDYVILKHYESEFFHRIVLNHLVYSALRLDNEELISLLKLGKESTYQTVLNRVLELNLTENECNNEMTLLSYVQKFLNENKK